MQDCRLFLLMLNTCACPTSTAVLTVGHFWHCFYRKLDRLRLTTINRDQTRPNETFIYTIIVIFRSLWSKMHAPKVITLIGWQWSCFIYNLLCEYGPLLACYFEPYACVCVLLHQESISSTFYARFFCQNIGTKNYKAVFWVWIFLGDQNIGKKAHVKCWWNWQQYLAWIINEQKNRKINTTANNTVATYAYTSPLKSKTSN
jgi:hypothetical protein